MIQVQDLRFAYADGRVALDGASFSVAEGECAGLIGPNGAGKTTLFLALSGVIPVETQRVLVAGIDPGDPGDRRILPAQVGIVFQNSDDQLFCSTVREDVAFGPLNLGLLKDEVERRVEEALTQVGLTGFEDRAPHHLSGGEKRRAALAGVLAMRPKVLLLDEPTIFLDPRGRREFIELIQKLPGTKLIATHDLDLVAKSCSRVIVLDRGRVAAQGSTSILDDRKLLEKHGLVG